MKPQKSPLVSFDRIAHTHGHGILLAGIVLLSAWLGGHSAVYRAYRNGGEVAPLVLPLLINRRG
jgi:hypothetical protein